MTNNLLAIFDYSELDQSSLTALYISIGALVFLLSALALLCVYGKKFNTKTIAFAGITLAASFVLSIAKIPLGLFGGSTTLASFVPLLIFTYFAGFVPGLIAGLLLGLLNFISEPWWMTEWTFVLDYLLAFGSICLMGTFKKLFKATYETTDKNGNAVKKDSLTPVVLGITLVYIFRLSMHVASGIIYFNSGIVDTAFPTSSAFIYSLCYNAVYLVPDYIIALIAMILLVKNSTLSRLEKIFTRK